MNKKIKSKNTGLSKKDLRCMNKHSRNRIDELEKWLTDKSMVNLILLNKLDKKQLLNLINELWQLRIMKQDLSLYICEKCQVKINKEFSQIRFLDEETRIWNE